MELVASDWCTRKWLRFDQTARNLTSSILQIPLVVIQPGVTGLEKTRSCISQTYLREGKKGQCDLMCGAPLDDWANAGLC